MSAKPLSRFGRIADPTLHPYELLRREVTEAIKTNNLDPDADRAKIETCCREAIERWQSVARQGLDGKQLLGDPEGMAQRILASVLEFGPLTELLADPGVEEIFIEGEDIFFLDQRGLMRGVSEVTTEAENLSIVRRLLQDSGREVTERDPIVQARCFGGTVRVGVVIPPIADRLSVTIRKYVLRNETLERLVAYDSITPDRRRAALDRRTGEGGRVGVWAARCREDHARQPRCCGRCGRRPSCAV